MANLLPSDKAAAELEYASRELMQYAGVLLHKAQSGQKPDKRLISNWKKAYSKVSSAQWELEQVLGA